MIELLDVLQEREERLKNRIQKERRSLKKMSHKSQRVRINSCLGSRIGFFTDHLQELQLIISLVQGDITGEKFVVSGNGDRLDRIATFVGGS